MCRFSTQARYRPGAVAVKENAGAFVASSFSAALQSSFFEGSLTVARTFCAASPFR